MLQLISKMYNILSLLAAMITKNEIMIRLIKIGIWNANRLIQRSHEFKTFLIEHDINIMLISETHFTRKSYLKIPRYNTYIYTTPKWHRTWRNSHNYENNNKTLRKRRIQGRTSTSD